MYKEPNSCCDNVYKPFINKTDRRHFINISDIIIYKAVPFPSCSRDGNQHIYYNYKNESFDPRTAHFNYRYQEATTDEMRARTRQSLIRVLALVGFSSSMFSFMVYQYVPLDMLLIDMCICITLVFEQFVILGFSCFQIYK